MITLIAAADLNGVIGKDNALPWRLPADLQRFKIATLGRAVIMGRRTFASLKRPLPGRLNIVLTRDAGLVAVGVQVAHSLEEALVIGARHHEEVMVMGGAAVYAEALPLCHRLLLTIVHGRFAGDAWLPRPAAGEWCVAACAHYAADQANAYATTVYQLVRPSLAPVSLAQFTWPDG